MKISAAEWDAMTQRLGRLSIRLDEMDGLARRVTELEQAAIQTDSNPPQHAEVAISGPFWGETGVYRPNPCCPLCGAAKPPSRVELTCKPCGTERNAIIKDPTRKLPAVPQCLNCGGTKTGTNLMCAPCSGGYKVWKVAH